MLILQVTKQVLITRGEITLIDESDWGLVCKYNWTLHIPDNRKYARCHYEGKKIYLHRLLLNAKPGEIVDHKNGDGLDNRRNNIRLATQSQNTANCTTSIKTASGFRGVYFDKRSGLWQAKIKFNYKSNFLGSYKTTDEAAKVYDEAAFKLFGEFARLNFPRM
jgi:hypothetical protein